MGTGTQSHNPRWNQGLLASERAAKEAGAPSVLRVDCAGGCGEEILGRGGSVYCPDCRNLCDELAEASRVDYSRRERS